MVRQNMPFMSEVVASPRIILIESVERLVSVEVEETIEELISQSTSSIAYRSTSDYNQYSFSARLFNRRKAINK